MPISSLLLILSLVYALLGNILIYLNVQKQVFY
nr:MAG TPA: hypothetical protein [Caudoviricetes sp.]